MEEGKEVKNGIETKERIQISIDNTDSALNWLERLLALLKEYGPIKILLATLLITIVSGFLYFTLNFTKVFEIYDAWRARQHDDKIELRMELGPKIQSLTDKLTYSLGATRTVVLELHNGNSGSGGLPFTKCTATYESLNIGKHPVGQYYQDYNMSLVPFAHTLFKSGYWCGDLKSLETIDRALYYRMKSNGTEHFAACVIEGVDNKPIAILIVSYEKMMTDMDKHNCEETREQIRHIAMELAVVLEVSRILGDK